MSSSRYVRVNRLSRCKKYLNFIDGKEIGKQKKKYMNKCALNFTVSLFVSIFVVIKFVAILVSLIGLF